MSYNPTIPTTGQPIVQSAPQLRANFQAINNTYAANHVGLTQDLSISGMHQLLTMRPQSGDPTTSSIQTAIYSKLLSYSGINQPNLFFRPNSDQNPIQLTYPSIKVDGSTLQYSFMAGPFLVYGGLLTNAFNGQVVNLTPGTSLIFVDLVVQYTSNIINNVAAATSISGNSFTVSFEPVSGGRLNIWYTAVGL